MEIHLDKRAVRQIRLSAQEAIEEDDTESLREDILEAFTEDQVEEIERRLDNGDFFEFLTDVIDEWSGDDVDELLELLETQLGEVGIDLKTEAKSENGKKMMATLFKVVLGLAFLVFGAWLVYKGWTDLLVLIKGSVGLFFLLAGVITLAIAKE